MSKKDYQLGIITGLLIGLLALPVLRAVQPMLFVKIAFFVPLFFLVAVPLGLLFFSIIGKKIPVFLQIGKFGVVGVLNTLIDWGVLAFLSFALEKYSGVKAEDIFIIGISFYVLYKSVSFICANLNSYLWNKFWTFSVDTAKDAKVEMLQFLAVSVIGFILNVAISSYVFNHFVFFGLSSHQREILGAAVGTVVILAWNFLGFKYIVFKPKLSS